jgi:hypothetical protein
LYFGSMTLDAQRKRLTNNRSFAAAIMARAAPGV